MMRKLALAFVVLATGCAAVPLPSPDGAPYCPDDTQPYLFSVSIKPPGQKGPNCTALCCDRELNDWSQINNDACGWYICDR